MIIGDIIVNYGIRQDIARILSKIPYRAKGMCERYKDRFQHEAGISAAELNNIKNCLDAIALMK